MNRKDDFVMYVIVLFFIAVIVALIWSEVSRVERRRDCKKKCDIARIKVMDQKCFCKTPNGWQEPQLEEAQAE